MKLIKEISITYKMKMYSVNRDGHEKEMKIVYAANESLRFFNKKRNFIKAISDATTWIVADIINDLNKIKFESTVYFRTINNPNGNGFYNYYDTMEMEIMIADPFLISGSIDYDYTETRKCTYSDICEKDPFAKKLGALTAHSLKHAITEYLDEIDPEIINKYHEV